MHPMRTIALAWLAAALVAWPAHAQESAPEAKTQAKAKEAAAQDTCHVRVFTRGGARLGIRLDTEPNPETDSVGVLVRGVTADGPAGKAGIREGDILTRFNGEPLAAPRGAEGRRARPGSRLIELVRELEPGDTVRLEIRRDGRTITQTLVAERREAFSFHGLPDFDRFGMDFHLPDLERLRELPRRIELSLPFRHRVHGLELVELNRDLGSYFGATTGVLVVDVPEGSPLGLKAGDVILSIGGRVPESPGHALRIVASYEPEETVRFEILREKKKQTVEGKLPERVFERRRPPEAPSPSRLERG
ncbi:MAG: PDZ domain-containing protein [Gemmatimonadota bacterium]